MVSKMCYICIYSEFEDKEYYLEELDNQAGIRALGYGFVWGLKKNALIFSSMIVAKSYLKFINRYRFNAYIKLIERR